jgi:four helix bundle protein
MLLNTAEGNSKRHGRQRAKFFDDARGSAFECAACLDASVAKRCVLPDRVRPGQEMPARVVAMLKPFSQCFRLVYCPQELQRCTPRPASLTN